MPLTPADVHNVGFSKAPIGRRGYDPEEVDAFLEEIERELDRLIEANQELRSAPSARAEPSTTDEQGLAAERERLRGELQRVREETAAAQRRARRLRQLLRARSDPSEHQALDVLMLAEESAQEHVADARREADRMLSNARAKADEVSGKAREVAKSLDRDIRAHYQEALGPLEDQVTALQTQIERLKTFERENQVRLRAYVQSRLRELAPPEGEEDEEAVSPRKAQRPATPPRRAS